MHARYEGRWHDFSGSQLARARRLAAEKGLAGRVAYLARYVVNGLLGARFQLYNAVPHHLSQVEVDGVCVRMAELLVLVVRMYNHELLSPPQPTP